MSRSSWARSIVPSSLAHPGPLPVALVPSPDCLVEQVELHAPVALTGPDVGQRAPKLRVPQERAQVIEGDDHPDVVNGAVRNRPDRYVGQRPAAKQPNVAGGRRGDGVVESQGHAVHEP